jgi:hypothetical protein
MIAHRNCARVRRKYPSTTFFSKTLADIGRATVASARPHIFFRYMLFANAGRASAARAFRALRSIFFR